MEFSHKCSRPKRHSYLIGSEAATGAGSSAREDGFVARISLDEERREVDILCQTDLTFLMARPILPRCLGGGGSDMFWREMCGTNGEMKPGL